MTAIKQTIFSETAPADNEPTVVAYRMGQLEKRFDQFETKLDDMRTGLVEEREFSEAKLEAKVEHDRLWAEIKAAKDWGRWAIRIIGAALIAGILTAIGLQFS